MKLHISIALSLIPLVAISQKNTETVKFYGDTKARISAGVSIPQNKKFFVISGIVASPIDTLSAPGSRERFGDTKTQAISIFSKIETLLKEAGLSMKDIVNLKAFVTPDKLNNGTFDFKGWNEAYDTYFNNPKNPIKPTRITMGIAILTNPEFLIEIEGIAVYP